MVGLFLIVCTPGGGRGPAREPVSPPSCNFCCKRMAVNEGDNSAGQIIRILPSLAQNRPSDSGNCCYSICEPKVFIDCWEGTGEQLQPFFFIRRSNLVAAELRGASYSGCCHRLSEKNSSAKEVNRNKLVGSSAGRKGLVISVMF